MDQSTNSAYWRGYLWLAVCVAAGIALLYLFLDSHQQDGGYHFVFARWAWRHHDLFVGVWNRPLFMFLYAVPALGGYTVARSLTVVISVLCAWQTWRVARFYGQERSELVILFLLAQPVFFILWADTMTEPLFALVFITALHLHLTGRVKMGAFVASLMLLARPEGFFLGVMWGVWLLFDKRLAPSIWRRIPWTLLLASGAFIWFLAAWAITGDVQYIRHDWPSQWNGEYEVGHIWDYAVRWPEVVGPLLVLPFVIGLIDSLARRRMTAVTCTVLTLFIIHSLFRAFGMFGSAGYPRYFVCVAPASALLVLAGWNRIANLLQWLWPPVRYAMAAVVIGASIWICFLYMDGTTWPRDAVAINDMHRWWQANQRPVSRFVWSEAYQDILLDHDPFERPRFDANREKNLSILRDLPRGTLVFWDAKIGPDWHNITADDIEAAGYRRLQSRKYVLRGYVLSQDWFQHGGPRDQEMHLLYKE